MAMSYERARPEIMRAMQVVRELIKTSNSLNARDRYLEVFEALHRELAALDGSIMAQSEAEYRAITLRFASSKAALEQARADAEKIAGKLGTVAQFIQSLAKLAGSL